MIKLLNVVIIILALVLVGIIIYPQWQETKTSELKIGCDSTVNSTAFLVAQAKGFFSENRIKPNLIFYEDPKKIVDDFLADKIECAVIPWPTILSVARGYDSIYVLASGLYRTSLPVDGVFVLPQSPIKQIKDLKNKRLGFSPLLKDIIHVFVHNLGLKPNEIRLVKIPNSGLLAALKAKVVDAIIVLEPERTTAINEGLVSLMDPGLPKAVISPFPGLGIIIKSKLLSERRRFTNRIKTVVDAGVTFVNANVEESRMAFLNFYKLDTAQYRKCYLPEYEKLAELNRGLIFALSAKMAEVDSSYHKVDVQKLVPQTSLFRQ
jgi:ABC-type nitrate/sulfonate/bicarbonate transport system substrate-binding protein